MWALEKPPRLGDTEATERLEEERKTVRKSEGEKKRKKEKSDKREKQCERSRFVFRVIQIKEKF